MKKADRERHGWCELIEQDILRPFQYVWRFAWGTTRPSCKRNRLRPVHRRTRLCSMENVQDRLVLVPFAALDETLELARLLVERLPHEDQLAIALRGAAANLRAEALLEP